MTDRLPQPLRITEVGRATIATAVAIDHDWALPASSVDKLIEALSQLSDDDLEAAYMLGYSLREAIVCIQIRRDMAAEQKAREEQ